jgi:hypothetical protein
MTKNFGLSQSKKKKLGAIQQHIKNSVGLKLRLRYTTYTGR